MSASPEISICIPAYKRLDFLKRLLDSISAQKFKSFEVIITDDSPDDIIESHIKNTEFSFPIKYYRNIPSKGTPLNWIEGIQYATGKWIKIIHDDDWLTDADSLQKFADAISEKTDCIFSGYYTCFENTHKSINKTISQKRFQKIYNHPHDLFASNEIGPPSVVMFRKTITELYDPELKWLVDIEAYVRIFQRYRCVYIEEPLITMSHNETQVTNDCFRNPSVEIYEALVYCRKHGADSYKSLKSYDAWWRLIRNLSVRHFEMLQAYSRGEFIPEFLQFIVRFQSSIPAFFLQTGISSKSLMLLCYYVFSIREKISSMLFK